MSNHIIDILVDTTLGEEHEGALLRVKDGVTVTLPKETTHKFSGGDDFVILCDSISSVIVEAENGVATSPLGSGTYIFPGQSLSVKYIGSDEYLLWY